MTKKWSIIDPNPQLQVSLSDALRIHPIVSQLLINRNITSHAEAKEFLFADLSGLHDPFLLKDMDVTVERIKKAKAKDELILIYGDYDADGITSSAVLKRTLEIFGVRVINYIPHRMNEGYGLNHAITEYAEKKGVCLLITVDCGITAFSEVKALHDADIDVIIIDHHEPSKRGIPEAIAVIDPKRKDCPYPYKGLAAVGLAFKLSQVLLSSDSYNYLDLVALGTIADVAELSGENRIFAKEGLNRIRMTKNRGLLSLMKSARLSSDKIRTQSIGFVLGPRINATGRIGSAEKALHLLLTDDEKEADLLAKNLEDINRQRQKIQNDVIEDALGIVEREINFKERKIIVISKEGWHQGVVGIAASRLADKYYRPTVIISLNDGVGTGSARSIDGFHIFEALNHCSEFLENYGGHKYAAGLTILENNIEAFKESLNNFAQERLTAEHLTPSIDIDCEVALSDINMDVVNSLELLEPHGEGNPPPLFCSQKLMVKGQPAVLSRDTLKFWVSDGRKTYSAVGFGMGRFYDLVAHSKQIDLAYSLTVDDWNKEPVIQLKVRDIRPSS